MIEFELSLRILNCLINVCFRLACKNHTIKIDQQRIDMILCIYPRNVFKLHRAKVSSRVDIVSSLQLRWKANIFKDGSICQVAMHAFAKPAKFIGKMKSCSKKRGKGDEFDKNYFPRKKLSAHVWNYSRKNLPTIESIGKEKRISYRLSNITLNDIYFRLERQSSVQLSSLQDATSE